ncbi:HTH-type transcriptional regulator cbl [Serratia fonticola]|uniref:HTH-type transcriptional regulator cbl n=1 Tax=Serratia fonticola TaxID=47917 RepID=A0A4U9TM99_SERFO|nr:HTH-type transcriptional regulator cbl [Serratia fonticola]
MNFQQLKIIRESARCNYNLTDVANALFTSQSGVSRHIRELEEELGIEIFYPPWQTVIRHDRTGQRAVGGRGAYPQ